MPWTYEIDEVGGARPSCLPEAQWRYYVEAAALKQKIAVVMFDQYGTVVDMQRGSPRPSRRFLAEGLGRLARYLRHVVEATDSENSMIDALIHRDHTPYRESATAPLPIRWTAADRVHPGRGAHLVADRALLPFPDVVAALAKLQGRLQDRRPFQRRSRHARGGGSPHGFVRPVISVGRPALSSRMATYTKAAEILGVPTVDPVRRQPCVRLHRR